MNPGESCDGFYVGFFITLSSRNFPILSSAPAARITLIFYVRIDFKDKNNISLFGWFGQASQNGLCKATLKS